MKNIQNGTRNDFNFISINFIEFFKNSILLKAIYVKQKKVNKYKFLSIFTMNCTFFL